jgi:hypothetical protein
MNARPSKVTDITPPSGADAPLPPMRAAFVAKRAVIAALREQLAGHERRLGELRPREATIASMRIELGAVVEEYQALRATQLQGDEVDAARMRELDRRRRELTAKLSEQQDEAASLSRAITRIEQDVGELRASISRHQAELPVLLAAAAREHTITKLKAGRLRQLMLHIATELADLFDGANVSELQRVQFEDARIASCLSIRQPPPGEEKPDEIILPMMIGPEFAQALREASIDVMTLMQARAQALLRELLESPAG